MVIILSKDFNYTELIQNATTPEERTKINDEFLKRRRTTRKIQNFKKWCFDNMFNIINSVITLLALVVAILSLLLQLKEQY